MSAETTPALYEAVLVPALQRIQSNFGYLKKEALQKYSADSGIPEYKLWAVASFFPHFQLTPPKKCTVKVCRDMACHLNGSGEMLRDLTATIVSDEVAVEGVSCVGRCDRAIAAGVTLQGHDHDLYYHNRTSEQMKSIVHACVNGAPPHPDHDADLPYQCKDWVLDAYEGKTPDYTGVRKAVKLRDASLRKAAELLSAQKGWGPERLEKFREAAIQQMRVEFKVTEEIAAAVLAWTTDTDWAEGPEVGGWSNAIIAELDAGALRGLGGAGIPAKQKWSDLRNAIRTSEKRGRDDRRGFIVVNGDESEPGTFKDREILLRAPHTVIEGVIIAGLVTGATQGFIYIRHEYPEQIEACRKEIERAEDLGICGLKPDVLGRPFHVSVFVSPGGYICGEQSALIEAMSDRRGEPRNMPPALETNGLMDLPTMVSNVETYAWVPYIWINGGKQYASLGENSWKGRRFFSISGDLKRPGVYEVPMGMTLRELIYGENYCQGMAAGQKFKAFAPSGPSGGFLPAKLEVDPESKAWQGLAGRRGLDPAGTEVELVDLELELDLFRGISPTGALGAGIVVYGQGRDMVAEALNSLEFYRVESCGKCVPCRVGSQKLASLASHLLAGDIDATRWEKELLPLVTEMGSAIKMASICGLGRSVPMPLETAVNFFEEDIQRHLHGANGTTVRA